MKNFFKKNGELKKWSQEQRGAYWKLRSQKSMSAEEHKFYLAYFKRSEQLRREEADKINSLDSVNHPAHYNTGKIEVIEFIEDKNLGFHLGNVVKYVARAGKKNPEKEIEDLEKAMWYLNRKIQVLKGNPGKPNDTQIKR